MRSIASLGCPSYEESILIELNRGNVDPAASWAADRLTDREPPGLLSVVRPELLGNLSLGLYSHLIDRPRGEAEATDVRNAAFNALLGSAENGDPAAISALPKVATTASQAITAIGLAQDNLASVAEWRSGRSYIQLTGTFNPMHFGHRMSISRALEVIGDHASSTVQVVQSHPRKSNLPSYKDRFAAVEERLCSSNIVDLTRTTLIDVPLGFGLAKVGVAQPRLVADIVGDSEINWLVGGDKFMMDVNNVRRGEALDKAGERFRTARIYVSRRSTESVADIEEGAAYVLEHFGTQVTIVPETTEQLAIQAASSAIRELRAAGNISAAEAMELTDCRQLPGHVNN